MIYYPLEAMQRAGIEEVLISSSPDHAGQFASLLKSGEEFGMNLYFTVQDKPGGIAEGIQLAEDFGEHGLSQILLARTPGQTATDQLDNTRIEALNQRARRIVVPRADLRDPSLLTALVFRDCLLRNGTVGPEDLAPEITEDRG